MYPQVFGKYVLERELARGGMARVLLATLRGAGGFEKKLVVKQIRDDLALDEDFVRRFVEEAKTTVALSHPNIVPVYELGVERGTYFLAMELVEGVSVAELLRDEKGKRKLTPEEGAYIGVEICRALDYAHRRMQVVHRDITPRNVMIDEEGQVKLIDFGIAARAVAARDPAARDKQVFGSPGHMPPEQMAGKELGPATDLFALAVLLMEAWSGQAPFRRKTPEECEAAMREKHPKPSDADIRLLTLDDPISRAMSLDPADRQQDADELGRALRKFLQEVDLGDVARGLGERAREVRQKAIAREERATKPELPNVGTPSREGESETATFAAREEIKKLSEAPPPPAIENVEAGTRKLAFLTPPVIPKEKIEELAKAVKNKGETSTETEAEKPVETIATAPIETPVRRPSAKSPVKQERLRIVLGGAAVLMVGAAVYYQSTHANSNVTNDNHPTATGTATSASTATSAATLSTSTSSSSAPSSSTSPPTSASPSASTAPLASDAHIALFGDPGTKVFVDGTSRGACPVRDLAIGVGSHEIKFVFEPTGESRSTEVKLTAGGHATLRSDFTGTTPTIHVDR